MKHIQIARIYTIFRKDMGIERWQKIGYVLSYSSNTHIHMILETLRGDAQTIFQYFRLGCGLETPGNHH